MTPTAQTHKNNTGQDWVGAPPAGQEWFCTFSGRGERGGGGLGVAQEHLLVQAPQGVVGGVGVLLHKHVTGRHDVDHDHLHHHSAGEEQLRRGRTGEKEQPAQEAPRLARTGSPWRP